MQERNLHNPQAVYFIGIGGIGMSALARYYKHAGALVAGYDRTSSSLTAELEAEGIAIHYEDNMSLVPTNFTVSNENVLVIYTPAVPAEHSELNYFKNNNYTVIKRSAALGHIAATKTTLAIAGTHGKTTTSTLLAHLLTQAGIGCTAFLGGISKNYQTNLLLSDSPFLVAEADEFDRSFLQLFPQIAVITATDADHLDIYGTADEMKQAFADFASQVKSDGILILKEGIELPSSTKYPSLIYRYSFDKKCDFYASNIRRMENGHLLFDLHLLDATVTDCELGILGWVNIENAVAAAAVAYLCGADVQVVKKSLANFAGVQRRFDVQLNNANCIYIDDYAHHPEELKAAITSLREIFSTRKITGIFQPHLYTRTRDFVDGFAASLSLLDELILLDIYPARELPIEGVSSKIIFDKVTIANKQLCTKETLLEVLRTKELDVLVTFGAGDIDRFVQPIREFLENKK